MDGLGEIDLIHDAAEMMRNIYPDAPLVLWCSAHLPAHTFTEESQA